MNFEVGDQLFLFGFSRGAFTVRSLAGLVRTCGILCRDALDLVDKAFHLYRDRSSAMHPRAREAVLFRRTYAVEEVTPIEFIGVWDTVGALGNPLLFGSLSPGNRFHDTDLSTTVRHAYQALAIDEKRREFEATLWHQQPDAVGQVLEQQWFPWCSLQCGRRVMPADAGLAEHDLALDWLVARATACGLGVTPPVSLPDPLASHAGVAAWSLPPAPGLVPPDRCIAEGRPDIRVAPSIHAHPLCQGPTVSPAEPRGLLQAAPGDPTLVPLSQPPVPSTLSSDRSTRTGVRVVEGAGLENR